MLAQSSYGPWRTSAGLCALCFTFALFAWPFVQRLGIEVDEALVGTGVYHGAAAAWYSWSLFANEIPVMLLSYLGALKAWIYNPIFAIWPPGPVSLRLPTVIAGILTLLLFFRLLERTLGRSIAWSATALLATDPMFILTESIDFGPNALHQLLKIGGLVSLVVYHRNPRPQTLALAFFLFGLGVWDKALFVWALTGIAIAGSLVFWREVRSHMRLRTLTIAASGFVLGALPFLVYNVVRPLDTVATNARISFDNPVGKLYLLKLTMNGSGYFGFLTAASPGPNPGHPRSAIQHAAFTLDGLASSPAATWTVIALVLCIAAIPLAWRTRARRPALFALLALLITWLQMALTTGAGAAVHHIALLWPFHFLLIAVVLHHVLPRRAAFAAIAVLCVMHVLVMNHYVVTLIRNGSTVRWTDAFPALSTKLAESSHAKIFTADWGILETLNLMSEGELPLQDASYALRKDGQASNTQALEHLLATAGAVWVSHTPGNEQIPGVNQALDRAALRLGYSKEVLRTIQDRNGRPIFDIIRFRRAS